MQLFPDFVAQAGKLAPAVAREFAGKGPRVFRAEFSLADEIVEAGVGLCFGPDTLAEARNRGYSLATPGATRRHRKPRA